MSLMLVKSTCHDLGPGALQCRACGHGLGSFSTADELFIQIRELSGTGAWGLRLQTPPRIRAFTASDFNRGIGSLLYTPQPPAPRTAVSALICVLESGAIPKGAARLLTQVAFSCSSVVGSNRLASHSMNSYVMTWWWHGGAMAACAWRDALKSSDLIYTMGLK